MGHEHHISSGKLALGIAFAVSASLSCKNSDVFFSPQVTLDSNTSNLSLSTTPQKDVKLGSFSLTFSFFT